MRQATIDALIGVARADATMTADEVAGLRSYLCGETSVGLASPTPLGRVVTHRAAAELLAVSTRTLQLYARRGWLRPVFLGARGKRSIGYTESSIRAALEGRRERQ